MKITSRALQVLLKEAIKSDRIIKERPWSVEHSFQLSGGKASDSEGEGPDGFAIVMSSESGPTVKVVVDTYWNPQSGDQSGNSIKIQVDDEVVEQAYVPFRFDDGKKQLITISNAPVLGLLCISHSPTDKSPPVVYAVIENPFGSDDDLEFSVENLGGTSADVQLTNHINL